MGNESLNPIEQPPEENVLSTIRSPKHVAGGLPAVISSMVQLFRELGFIRGFRAIIRLNQKRGFDCPGCAWPEPDDRRSVTEFCENGVKAVAAEITAKNLSAEVFSRWSVKQLGELSDYELGKLGRLTEPMILRAGSDRYVPISWIAANELIAKELNALSTPDEAVFYTSGRTSNEAAFLYQLFVRIFGTNNLPDCSNMCHESSGVALMEAIGIGKGTVTLEDFDHADCIVVMGQNPGTNHPRMLTALQRAVEKGCQIISINPLTEAGVTRFKHPQKFWTWFGRGTRLASIHLPVRINGDVALLKGLLKELLSEEDRNPGSVLDREFIKNFTEGFEEFREDIASTPWDTVVKESGISREVIQQTASVLKKSKRMIICWAMGLTQHKNAIANIQQVVNLLLLRGHFGRKGAGVCPVRGHSNVQGDRTMGIYEQPSKLFLDALKREFSFDPPRHHGYDTVAAIKAMHAGRVKVFFAMGGNFLSATPDTQYTAQALKKCSLTAQISTKLNRGHLVTGQQALILPCLARSDRDKQSSGDQFVTTENSMGVIEMSQGKLEPLSKEMRSEVAIVAELALEVFKNQPEKLKRVDWTKCRADYSTIRLHISRVVPGFENYEKRVLEKSFFYLPNSVRDQKKFNTRSGKALFTVHPIPVSDLREDQFVLMTIRSHDQYNTTIYGLNDRYRGIAGGRRVIFMNPEDISLASLAQGMAVDITSHFQGETRLAKKFQVVPYAIPKRCVATYFPEANVLVPIDSKADRSNTPTYKSITVSVAPST